jgi:hypothetical protein
MEVKELDGEFSERTVSHGICEKCKDKALEEIRNEKPQTKKGGYRYVEHAN